MPDDPNKKMDDLLKAYARERRKAPELNLHPVTRKMLQAEVARTIGSENDRPSWLYRLRAFWPQIAFAGSLCVILGIAVLSLRQPPEETTESLSRPAVVPGKDAVLKPGPQEPTDYKADTQLVMPMLKQVAEPELRESERLQEQKEQKKAKAEANVSTLRDLPSEPVAPEGLKRSAPPAERDNLPASAPAPTQLRSLSAAEAQVELRDRRDETR